MFGFLKQKLQQGLAKTVGVIKNIVPEKVEKIDRDLVEEILIESDVEYDIVELIIDKLPKEVKREHLEKELLSLFTTQENLIEFKEKPFVELIIGVNGAGKTTTIAKLTNNYKKAGFNVMLGAGDTFRAAAIEQLKIWAEKLDVPIVYTKQDHDPSAVAYDTIISANSKNIDRVLIDTAGRLHNKANLGNELKKIVRVCNKAKDGAPHRKLLILDGTQGNSAIEQAKAFNTMIGIDGIIITKLDGTAKGGAIFSISKELKVPILYIGVGEKQDDLIEFNPKDFIDTILNEIYISKDITENVKDDKVEKKQDEIIEDFIETQKNEEIIIKNEDIIKEETVETDLEEKKKSEPEKKKKKRFLFF